MSGGNGATGSGGNADMSINHPGEYTFYIDSYGTGGAPLGVRKAVPTAFAMPAQPQPAFGYTLVVVTGNTIVDVWVDMATAKADATLVDGQLFLILGDDNLYVRDSTVPVDGLMVASGLKVNPGAKLTLGLNMNSYAGQTGQDKADIYTEYDIVIAGTATTKTLDTGTVNGGVIETGATDRDKGMLELYSGLNLFVTASGKILTNGDEGQLWIDWTVYNGVP